MRLLVTGASGLIGRHVVELAAESDDIELIASARTQSAGLPATASFMAADLSDASQAAELIRATRPTHILHAAWETRHPTYWEDVANLDWVASATRMAEAFAEVGGRRFIQVGSCAEYDWSYGMCVEDETPSRPATRYGEAKLAAFRSVADIAQNRFEAAEARMFMVFGPGENPARFIPTICGHHLAGTVPRLGSGIQARDFLYVKDAAEALLHIVRADGAEGIFNVAAGEPVTLAAIARMLAQLANAAETGLGLQPDRPGDPARLTASAARLRNLAWQPRYPLEAALGETLAWWREEMRRAASD